MEQKLSKLTILTMLSLSVTLSVAQQNQKNPTTGVFQSDLLLNNKKVYRNYPPKDMSYRDWDKKSKLISSYVDEEFGTLYEDKIKDSIVFRKGTNDEHKYVEFWWFKLISPKDSIYFKSKNIAIRVGAPIEVILKIFPDMEFLYQQEMEDEKNREKEIQLYTNLWFRFYDDSEDYSLGSFQVYVQNDVITRITINFMTEGDMP